MPKVHLMIGIQGSGKSTFSRIIAKEQNITIVSTDVVRQLHPDWPEENIWPEVYKMTASLVKTGEDVIFDATNITPKVRERFINNVLSHFEGYTIKNLPFELYGYYFNVNPDICRMRVEKRNLDPNELYLPPEVVYSYNERLVEPSYNEPFEKIYYVENNELIEKRKGD